jgi:hypothetical protein
MVMNAASTREPSRHKASRALWAFGTSLGLIWAVGMAAGLLLSVR